MSNFNDLIVSGCGFLNSVHVLGQDAKQSKYVTIAALFGRKDASKNTYFECLVVEDQSAQFINTYEAQIKDPNSTVFARFDLGDPELKLLAPKDDRSNSILKAKLIRITYLKVNGEVVYHKAKPSSQGSAPSTQQKPVSQPVVGDIPTLIAQATEVIKLDKNSATFTEDKELLKGAGYRWCKESFAWVLKANNAGQPAQQPQPQQQPSQPAGAINTLIQQSTASIKLKKGSPTFEADKQQLKDAGYRWCKESFSWVLKANNSGQPAQQPQPQQQPSQPAGAISALIQQGTSSIKLKKDSPTFDADKQQLKDAGYRWCRDSFAWVK